MHIFIYLKLFYLKIMGISQIFITDDGLGDCVMATVVAKNYFQRSGKKCSIIHSNQDILKHNPYVFPINGISPYFFSPRRQIFLKRLGLTITTLSSAHVKYTIKGEPYSYFARENLLLRLCIQAGFTGKIILEPEIYLTAKEKSFGSFYKKQIVITMGSGFYKRLNVEQIQKLVNLLKNDYHIIQVGSSDDTLLEGVLDLRGRLAIRDTAAVLFHSRLFIGPIGGIMHVARAVKCPSVIIHASAEDINSHYPEFERVTSSKSCTKCCDEECYAVACAQDFSCSDAIPFETILAAVQRELAKPETVLLPNIVEIPEPDKDSAPQEITSKVIYTAVRNVKLLYQKSESKVKWEKLERLILMDNRFYQINFQLPNASSLESLYLDFESSDFIYQFRELSIYDEKGSCMWKSSGDANDFSKIEGAVYFTLNSGYYFLPFGSHMKLFFPDIGKTNKIGRIFLEFSLWNATCFKQNFERHIFLSNFNNFSYSLGCFLTYFPRQLYSFFTEKSIWLKQQKQKMLLLVQKRKIMRIQKDKK